jgi:flagellar motility protein MotE (MotC chaperone)
VRVTKILARVRLLPAVLALGGALLLVKTEGFFRDAQAQAQSTQPLVASTEPVPSAKAASSADDTESSSSEVDVLTSLSRRRAELDSRDRELKTQQELIAAAEKRVDDKIASLKLLQSQIQALLALRDSVQQKQVDSLVKTYSAMKPKDAARIFNSLENEVLVAVASQMKPDVLAPVLAQMQSEQAQKLTLKLADRLKLPDPPPPPPASPLALQTASAQPMQTQAPIPPAIPAGTAPGEPAAAPAPPAPAPAAGTPTGAPAASGK